MAQIRIYGLRAHLSDKKPLLSETIHACVVEALALPPDKRFHRFILLEADEFYFPPDRSSAYTVIEISMFEGRSIEAKKQLIRLLFERLQAQVNMAPQDVEITIYETPKHNWGIRGKPGDELHLNYEVDV